MKITYELIESLIVESQIQGSKMMVQFQVPNSDEIIESSASIKRERTVQNEVKRVVSRNVSNQLRRSVSQLVRGILGGGMLGRLGYQTVNTATRETTKNLTKGYSTSDKQNAIIAAFEKVEEKFEYDSKLEKWTLAGMLPHIQNQFSPKTSSRSNSRKTSRSKKEELPSNLSPFEEQLYKAPVKEGFDKEILSRMLIELANADGDISVEEESFLKSFISNYDDYAKFEPLSSIECEEVSEIVKPTIFLLGWAIALVDLDLDPMEEAKLDEYGDWFELSVEQKTSLKTTAKAYILEQSVDVDTSRIEVFKVAEKLGIDQNNALRMFIRYKKRQG